MWPRDSGQRCAVQKMKTPSALALSLFGWLSFGTIAAIVLLRGDAPAQRPGMLVNSVLWLLSAFFLGLTIAGAVKGGIGLWRKQNMGTNLAAVALLIPVFAVAVVMTRAVE